MYIFAIICPLISILFLSSKLLNLRTRPKPLLFFTAEYIKLYRGFYYCFIAQISTRSCIK